MKRIKKGFTLVELMVVITVIAILMTIAVVSFTRIQKQARDTKRKSDLRTLATALQAYFTENMSYPASADWQSALTPNYIPNIPAAPAGVTGPYSTYTYLSGANNFTYALCASLEVPTQASALWVINTANAGGYQTADSAGNCVAQ